MEHALFLTLVVITLLQPCRAQTSNSTPEWYAANDINDTNFSPKPITELFSTETSFSPDNPIVVLPATSPLPSNRGVVSSPSSVQYPDSPLPPNVIPLSSTESPSSPQLPDSSQSTSSDTQLLSTQQRTEGTSTTPGQPSSTVSTLVSENTQGLSSQVPVQVPRTNENSQIVQQNQPPMLTNRVTTRQMQPPNVQFLLPTQMGNRNFNPLQQFPPNVGQPNYIVLYQQAPQSIQNLPPFNPQGQPQSTQQQIPSRPLNMAGNRPVVQQQQIANPIVTQPNAIPRHNMPPTVFSPPSNTQLPNQVPGNETTNNQQSNQPFNNQVPISQQRTVQLPNYPYIINQIPNNLQPGNQFPTNFVVLPYVTNNGPMLSPRPARQRNRVNGGRLNNRGTNRLPARNMLPCQGTNGTVVRPPTPATNQTKNPVITIRLTPSKSARIDASTVRPTTSQPKRQNSQINNRNYERCLNSCRDRKDRICAGPESDIEINPETLKGFPSMCHMACHNTFRSNPIYGKIANGRCGKLRTRIQTVDKTKVRRDELKKSQYTIISNVPGTVVELAQ